MDVLYTEMCSVGTGMVGVDVLESPAPLLSMFLLVVPLTCLCFPFSLMPSLLAAVKSTSEPVHSEVCLLSALAALHKVVETLPHFISPYLEGVLSQVSSGD